MKYYTLSWDQTRKSQLLAVSANWKKVAKWHNYGSYHSLVGRTHNDNIAINYSCPEFFLMQILHNFIMLNCLTITWHIFTWVRLAYHFDSISPFLFKIKVWGRWGCWEEERGNMRWHHKAALSVNGHKRDAALTSTGGYVQESIEKHRTGWLLYPCRNYSDGKW